MPWVNLHYSSFASPPDLRRFSSDLWMLDSGDASNLGLAREQYPQLGEKWCEGQSRHALNAKIGPYSIWVAHAYYTVHGASGWFILKLFGSCGAFSKKMKLSERFNSIFLSGTLTLAPAIQALLKVLMGWLYLLMVCGQAWGSGFPWVFPSQHDLLPMCNLMARSLRPCDVWGGSNMTSVFSLRNKAVMSHAAVADLRCVSH